MIQLNGHTIAERVYIGERSELFRGHRDEDQLPLIYKNLRLHLPELALKAKLSHEHEMLQGLKLSRIVRTYGLQRHQRGWVLLLEDFGGASLREYLTPKTPLELDSFFALALELLKAIEEIHAHHLLHKDLKPSNIIVVQESQEPPRYTLKLTDFHLSSRQTFDHRATRRSTRLEGTLDYISPEQTGRINKAVDARSDLYSLGVILYELLVGSVPFTDLDANGLLHAHIARQPIAPHIRRSTTPRMLSHIVMKLLEKNPSARYQSAHGVRKDLEHCAHKWQTTGQIETFTCALHDTSNLLASSQDLWGREEELEVIEDALRLAHTTSSQWLLLHGASGTGKSLLARAASPMAVRIGGFFAEGTCERTQQNVPYSVLIEAFADVVDQLLAQSASQVAVLRHELHERLAGNGALLIDLLPNVAKLLGPQPEVAQLDPVAAQHRLEWTFHQLLETLVQYAQPLILFLDDLQWADPATLSLLHQWTGRLAQQHLLVIGTYRPEKLSQHHALHQSIEAITEQGFPGRLLEVKPFTLKQIATILTQRLHADDTQALATCIFAKTGGNPFFLFQFIASLQQKKLLVFDVETEEWSWDLPQVQAQPSTYNILEWMEAQLKELPLDTQEVLMWGALFGTAFDLSQLAPLLERSPQALFAAITGAAERGLVMPTSEYETATAARPLLLSWRFSHTRIQAAAFGLGEPATREAAHWAICRQLQAQYQETPKLELLFQIVEHYNNAGTAISNETERLEQARWNLRAGIQSKRAAAYDGAYLYLSSGHKALQQIANADEAHPALSFSLAKHLIEAAFLVHQYAEAEALLLKTIPRPVDRAEKVSLFAMLVRLYASAARYQEALDFSRQGLALLDMTLPTGDLSAQIGEELTRSFAHLAGRTPASLLALPPLTDPLQQQRLSLLADAGVPAFFSDPTLWTLLVLKAVNLAHEHGRHPTMTYFYASYGIVLCNATQQYPLAHEFSQLSLAIAREEKRLEHLAPAAVMSGCIDHWVTPLPALMPLFEEGRSAALATGNQTYAGFLLQFIARTHFYMGTSLQTVYEHCGRAFTYGNQTNNFVTRSVLAGMLANLRRLGLEDTRLPGEEPFDEEAFLAFCQAHLLFPAIINYQTDRAMICLLEGNFAEGLNAALAVKDILHLEGNTHTVKLHNFIMSMLYCALYPKAPEEEQPKYWQAVEENQAIAAEWMALCPGNVAHYHALVAAEMAAIQGDTTAAIRGYTKACECAIEGDIQYVAALAHERAAAFWDLQEQTSYANMHLQQALDTYVYWGATAKAQLMHKESPHIWPQQSYNAATSRNHTTTLTQQTSSSKSTYIRKPDEIDLASVLKASQAITEEIELARLVPKLIAVVLENLGAQEGWLLLCDEAQHENTPTLYCKAYATPEGAVLLPEEPLHTFSDDTFARRIIAYTFRNNKTLLLDDARLEGPFQQDPYVRQKQCHSVLCFLLQQQQQTIGCFYFENNLTSGAFTQQHLAVLDLLSAQVISSLQHSLQVEQIARARREADAMNRAKTTFLANMSHELRTPLNAIIGYTELIEESVSIKDYDSIDGDLKKIRKSGSQLLGLIHHVLDLTEIEADKAELKKSHFSLAQLLQECLVEANIGQGELHLEDLVDDLLHTDRSRLYQILYNILSNAEKFGEEKPISITATNNETQVTIQIQDQGIGMTPDVLAQLFQPFFQADPSTTRAFDGVGLGLTIAREYCQLLKGELLAESQVDKGSTFTIILPR